MRIPIEAGDPGGDLSSNEPASPWRCTFLFKRTDRYKKEWMRVREREEEEEKERGTSRGEKKPDSGTSRLGRGYFAATLPNVSICFSI